jgi:transposase
MKISISFKCHIKQYIINHNLYMHNHNTKYTLDQILDVIEYILITGASWRSLNLSIFYNLNIKWQSFYYHFIKFSKANVFKNFYMSLLTAYFKNNKSGKLKYLSVDTSFIKNYCASNVAFNGYCKKKKLSKLSLIVDSYGIPISALLAEGNHHNFKLMYSNLNNLFIPIKTPSNKYNNKHKRYMLADSIYYSHDIVIKLNDMNINPIIARKKNSLRRFTFSEKCILKKRMIVENTFSWIFNCKRTNGRYDKSTNSYMSFLFMSLIKIIIKRL